MNLIVITPDDVDSWGQLSRRRCAECRKDFHVGDFVVAIEQDSFVASSLRIHREHLEVLLTGMSTSAVDAEAEALVEAYATGSPIEALLEAS